MARTTHYLVLGSFSSHSFCQGQIFMLASSPYCSRAVCRLSILIAIIDIRLGDADGEGYFGLSVSTPKMISCRAKPKYDISYFWLSISINMYLYVDCIVPDAPHRRSLRDVTCNPTSVPERKATDTPYIPKKSQVSCFFWSYALS